MAKVMQQTQPRTTSLPAYPTRARLCERPPRTLCQSLFAPSSPANNIHDLRYELEKLGGPSELLFVGLQWSKQRRFRHGSHFACGPRSRPRDTPRPPDAHAHIDSDPDPRPGVRIQSIIVIAIVILMMIVIVIDIAIIINRKIPLTVTVTVVVEARVGMKARLARYLPVRTRR